MLNKLARFFCAAWATGLLMAQANAAVQTNAGPANPSDGWRIECSGNAESSGTINFRVQPNQGDPIAVAVQIKQGRGENEVAKDIRDAFRAQLPADRFQTETDDGEDVLVKAKSNQPDFSIVLVGSDVDEVRLNLQRE